MTYTDEDCMAEQVAIMKEQQRKRNRDKQKRQKLGFWRYWWGRIW